jgi:hypothetical protein
VYLLESLNETITGLKLPSLRQVLGFFLHQHLTFKKSKSDASALTIDEIQGFWQRAKIPVRARHHCQSKVVKVFEEWRLLKKNQKRKTKTQLEKEEAYCAHFEDLFDIAHANALNMITIQEDRDFLLAQREKGRRGTMAGVDIKLDQKEKRKAKKMAQQEARAHREQKAQEASTSKVATDLQTSNSSSNSESSQSTDEVEWNKYGQASGGTPPCKKQKRMDVVTPSLSSALDRSKMTDRKAMMVVTATAQSLGHDVNELALSRSSIRRLRQKHRANKAQDLKAELRVDVPLTVHWDGKLIPDLTGKQLVDRLPIIVSGVGVSQLLTVDKLTSGTGQAQADAVINALKEWGIEDSVRALSFDTTSSNTGRLGGACVLIEQGLGTNLLFLACRHHIFEIMIGAVFMTCMGPSSGPDVLLFKRFQGNWKGLNLEDFEDASTDEFVYEAISDMKDDALDFIQKRLAETHPRDDYRELLELSMIVLGKNPARGIQFKAPGPIHHARWMSKIIYSLKVWLFRDQFKLTRREQKGLREMVVFTIRIYLRAWMTAPLAASAPNDDLLLLKSLVAYEARNQAISKAATTKLAGHLWYLSEELIGLAFFDKNVPAAVKRLMILALEKEGHEDPPKRIQVDLQKIKSCGLEDFVTQRSRVLFERMNLPDSFLKADPETWEERDDYKAARQTVQAMKVVNDHAERGVALIQEFSGLLTHDEVQLQFLLQVVQEHRKDFPDSNKKTLTGNA